MWCSKSTTYWVSLFHILHVKYGIKRPNSLSFFFIILASELGCHGRRVATGPTGSRVQSARIVGLPTVDLPKRRPHPATHAVVYTLWSRLPGQPLVGRSSYLPPYLPPFLHVPPAPDGLVRTAARAVWREFLPGRRHAAAGGEVLVLPPVERPSN